MCKRHACILVHAYIYSFAPGPAPKNWSGPGEEATNRASLTWPDPTRKEGSGPMPNMHLYQHPTDNWGCDKWLWL